MNTHDVETENLAAHVSLCQERYQRLTERLAGIDHRFERIETQLTNIENALDALGRRDHDQWRHLRDVVISVLTAVSAFLLAQHFWL